MDATVHCRTHASLFDVSHMCGFTLKVRGRMRACKCFVRQVCFGTRKRARLLPPSSQSALARSAAASGDVGAEHARNTQGKEAIPFLESLVVGDIAGLEDGTGCLTLYTNEKGGIIDDSVIIKV